MPAQLQINADVVDLRNDSPQVSDQILVDTNVWFWLTYQRASQGTIPPKRYQTTDYPRYVKALRVAKAKLYRSGLHLAELSHIIEKTEREIFAKTSAGHGVTTKEYRHNFAQQRTGVVNFVRIAWHQVKGMANLLPLTLHDAVTDNALTRFQTQPLDGYDLFLLESMHAAGVSQVLTDDCDYATVPGITVFTANNAVISAASQQGRLITR